METTVMNLTCNSPRSCQISTCLMLPTIRYLTLKQIMLTLWMVQAWPIQISAMASNVSIPQWNTIGSSTRNAILPRLCGLWTLTVMLQKKLLRVSSLVLTSKLRPIGWITLIKAPGYQQSWRQAKNACIQTGFPSSVEPDVSDTMFPLEELRRTYKISSQLNLGCDGISYPILSHLRLSLNCCISSTGLERLPVLEKGWNSPYPRGVGKVPPLL